MPIQLDLFKEQDDIELYREEIRSLTKSQDKLRKAMFARHGELSKKYLELNDRFEVLERVLCKGKYGNLF
jgi:hypothetical protein